MSNLTHREYTLFSLLSTKNFLLEQLKELGRDSPINIQVQFRDNCRYINLTPDKSLIEDIKTNLRKRLSEVDRLIKLETSERW